MRARVGLLIQEFTTLLHTLFARHKSLTHEDTLQAIEFLRYTITEQALRRSHPELMRDDPADKKRGGRNAVSPPKNPPPTSRPPA